ncbi:unnamed protein product [Adineta ricciae]|uniref:Uncharacterized protein n=1 Tax=Adineta ricciae TaxID=249248 RepID=A0A814DD50_ADIRI|nr:unnamed protein product [Adineta ricciae]CAF1116256.1 unnamed protein product [Adineta ricciae]
MKSDLSHSDDGNQKFLLVGLENQSNIDIPNKFQTLDALQAFIADKKEQLVVVIIGENISSDAFSIADFPQICAIYNEKLVCLYCSTELVQSVHAYIQKIKTKQETKAKVSSSCLIPIIRKYWFLVGLILAILFAYLFPNVGKTGGYIRSEWSVKLGCVMFIFFVSGLSLRTRQLVQEILHIRLHGFVQIYSLLIIPFIVYGLCLLLVRLSLNKTLVIGLIIMGSTSTTISSNVVMTKNALGNEYAALVNAVVGNILGIFLSPALIFFFVKNPVFNSLSSENNTENGFEYGRVLQKLVLTILLPLLIGQIIHLIWTKRVTYLREKLYFAELNSLALLILVWAVFSTAFATGTFKPIHTQDLVILFAIGAGLYVFFSVFIMILARLPIPHWQFSQTDTVAIMFCGATKTLAMGIPLISALYGNQRNDMSGVLSLPLIIYHVEQLVLGAVEVILLKNWVKKGLKREALTQKTENDIELGEREVINVKS